MVSTPVKAIEDVFGEDVDYAMLHKIYGAPTDADQLTGGIRATSSLSCKTTAPSEYS